MCPQDILTSKDFSLATLAAETDEIPICLIEITHPDLTEPIRLSSDKTELYKIDEETGEPIYITRHKGNMYIYSSFTFIRPATATNGTIPNAKFIVAGNQRIRQAIREVHDNVTIKSIVVLASDLETVITETPVLWLSKVSYAGQIEAEFTLKHFLNRKCHGIKFLPSITPGIYKAGTSN